MFELSGFRDATAAGNWRHRNLLGTLCIRRSLVGVGAPQRTSGCWRRSSAVVYLSSCRWRWGPLPPSVEMGREGVKLIWLAKKATLSVVRSSVGARQFPESALSQHPDRCSCARRRRRPAALRALEADQRPPPVVANEAPRPGGWRGVRQRCHYAGADRAPRGERKRASARTIGAVA
jgi:hypothetical protein